MDVPVEDRVDVRLPDTLAFPVDDAVRVVVLLIVAVDVGERVPVIVLVPRPVVVPVRVVEIVVVDVAVLVVVREDVVVRVMVTVDVAVRVGFIVCVPLAELVGDTDTLLEAVGVLEIGAVFVAIVVEDDERVDVVVFEADVVPVEDRVLVTLFVTIDDGEGLRVVATDRVAVRVGCTVFVANAVRVESFDC